MERNWLIRTSQNQILGPVAKSKVLEFLQKGALGLNDEVTSGNGYWFSLKEKDLVDKYLFGDLPQSYNPISEAKSVLAKRDNPDRTTSINSAPANKSQNLKNSNMPGVLPDTNDLEFPDITMVNNTLGLQLKEAALGLKIPTSDDLEFPDVSGIKNSPPPVYETTGNENKHKFTQHVSAPVDPHELIIYPEEQDLAYPEIETVKTDVTGHVQDESSIGSFDLDEEEAEVKTETKAEPKYVEDRNDLFHNDPEDNSKLDLIFKTVPSSKAQSQDKKLFHEKKIKASHLSHSKDSLGHEAEVDVTEQPKKVADRTMPEHLKKRNDNYLLYLLIILVLIILSLFFYYYSTILNKPLPV